MQRDNAINLHYRVASGHKNITITSNLHYRVASGHKNITITSNLHYRVASGHKNITITSNLHYRVASGHKNITITSNTTNLHYRVASGHKNITITSNTTSEDVIQTALKKFGIQVSCLLSLWINHALLISLLFRKHASVTSTACGLIYLLAPTFPAL